MPSKERVVTVVDLVSDDDVSSKAPTSTLINTEALTSPKKEKMPKAVLVESDSKSQSPQPTPHASPMKGPKQKTLQSFFLKSSSGNKLKATQLPKRKANKNAISQEIKDIVLVKKDLNPIVQHNDNGTKLVQTTRVILPEVVCGARRRTNRIIMVERIPLTSPSSLSSTNVQNISSTSKDKIHNAEKPESKEVKEILDSNEPKLQSSSKTTTASEKIVSDTSTLKDKADLVSSKPEISSKTTQSTQKFDPKSKELMNLTDPHLQESPAKEKKEIELDSTEKNITKEEKISFDSKNKTDDSDDSKIKCIDKKAERNNDSSLSRGQMTSMKESVCTEKNDGDEESSPAVQGKNLATRDKDNIGTSATKSPILEKDEPITKHVNILQGRKKKIHMEPSKSLTHGTSSTSLTDKLHATKISTNTEETRKHHSAGGTSNRKLQMKTGKDTPAQGILSMFAVKKTSKPKATESATKETETATNETVSTISCKETKVINSSRKRKATSIDTSITAISSESSSKKKSESDTKEVSLPEWYLTKHFSMHETLRKRYENRLVELEQRKLIEEQSHDEVDTTNKTPILSQSNVQGAEPIFPDCLVSELADLVQGSSLPLSSLAKNVVTKSASISKISMETVTGKIKLIAQRKSYLRACTLADRFENQDPRSMWRWEVISDSLLTNVSVVKKARSARRKLMHQYRAIGRFLQAMKDADSAADSPKIHKLLAKVSEEEEKVLKYEREEEKKRLLIEEKKRKEQERVNEKRIKEEEKRRKDEEKQKKEEERKIKEKEKREKDEEKRMAKEMERLKKLEEKEKRRKEEETNKQNKQLEKVRAAKKQKARMMSFFKAPASNTETISNEEIEIVHGNSIKDERMTVSESKREGESTHVDSDLFWARINGGIKSEDGLNLSKLTSKAKTSRQRNTSTVSVRVFVTVVPENIFEQKPFAEERTIRVKNKYKFLSFYEDHRPAYRGTWSKPRSSLVSGRNPFGKDTRYLNYDVDSEAEWEDGDDDQGEDCDEDCNDDEEKFDDEEGDTRVYNYQDGWLAADDELGYELKDDDDEETRALRKRRVEAMASANGLPTNNLCVIAPRMGGFPQYNDEKDCPELVEESVEGVSLTEAGTILKTHSSQIIQSSSSICLSVFAPWDEPEKKESNLSTGGNPLGNTNKSSSNEMSEEDMKSFAKFVHLCKLQSKEKVVEELRTKHKDLTSSRAQALRKLDSIATKRRLPNGAGVIWDVKENILKSLGLEDLIKPIEPTIDTPIKSPPVKKKRTKETNKNDKISSPKGKKNPVPVTPIEEKKTKCLKSTPRKRKVCDASTASINLLASFLKKKCESSIEQA